MTPGAQEDYLDVVQLVRSMLGAGRQLYCSDLILPAEFGDGRGTHGEHVCLLPRGIAPSGDFLRIYLNNIGDAAIRLNLCNLMREAFEPSIEGYGEVRVITE